MSVAFLGRTYASPLWLASGTYGWGFEAVDGGFFPRVGVGALVTKGVSPKPMKGAPQSRIAEVGHGVGLLNAIGLQNPGVDVFVSDYLPRYRNGDVPCLIWVNVFADSLAGYVDVISKIRTHLVGQDGSWLAGFEVNVSCPNVDKGGAEFGSDPTVLADLVKNCVKASGPYPVMVKLSPLTHQGVALALACESAGAQALAISNTLLGGFPEPEKSRAAGAVWSLGRRFGGLSGPALKPVSLRMIAQIKEKCALPLCGIGGIATAHDFQEYFCAGASVVQVGTANFANPWICEDISRGLGLDEVSVKTPAKVTD